MIRTSDHDFCRVLATQFARENGIKQRDFSVCESSGNRKQFFVEGPWVEARGEYRFQEWFGGCCKWDARFQAYCKLTDRKE